jgi:hypothetical protein
MYQEVEIEQEVQVVDIRESWQVAVTDGPWTLTPEESLELLEAALGNSERAQRAIVNVAVSLRKKNQTPNQYRPEELIEETKTQVIEELQRQIVPKTSCVPESVMRIKADRKRNQGSISDLKDEVERRVQGHTFSEEEVRNMLKATGNRVALVLQGTRDVGNLISKFDVRLSHQHATEKISNYLKREMSKVPSNKSTTS